MPKIDAITFKQLRALHAIARHGSITGAAGELGLTPPAVHTQIKSLERALLGPLVQSTGNQGATLTPEGEVMLEATEHINATLTGAVERIKALQHGQSGVIVLGVVSTAKYFVPGLVAKIGQAFEDIDIILKVGNRQFIISSLINRTIDVAIMGRPPRSPANTAYPIGPHPHLLIAASANPLATRDEVSAEDLLAQTFLTREAGSGTRILMARYLDRLGDGMPYRTIEMGSNETIKQAVIANLGVAMISQHAVTEEIKQGRLVALRAPGLPITRQWYLLHREDMRISKTFETVRDFILAQKADFLPKLEGEG